MMSQHPSIRQRGFTLLELLAVIATIAILAALLVEDRKWGDTHSHVAELKRRYHIRHRKHRVRQVERAVTLAQATGDPALPALEDELRALLRDLQREAEAVRELALARPALPNEWPMSSQRQAETP